MNNDLWIEHKGFQMNEYMKNTNKITEKYKWSFQIL